MKYYAIVVAGGSGNRMQSEVAKQFLLLDGKPILMHTLDSFYKCVLNPELLLVLNIQQHAYWAKLCEQYNFSVPHEIISGGEQRFHSVKNGLDTIKDQCVVIVHDAVRPLVTSSLIERAFIEAEEKGNAIAGIHPTDSIRRIFKGNRSEAISRDCIVLIQTPQAFKGDILKKAYLQPFKNEFTDDASVVESDGVEINVIEGERANIKITFPEDMEIANLLLKRKGS
jgi:2-C-methyl-D-erythritol 4-phosphate cytidylyltransferase